MLEALASSSYDILDETVMLALLKIHTILIFRLGDFESELELTVLVVCSLQTKSVHYLWQEN